MPRRDRALADVPPIFDPDPARAALRVANLAQAIAGGELAAAWQLGVDAIRAVLREDGADRKV